MERHEEAISMKPILFLDIDGVLNSRHQRGMESDKVGLLKRILDTTGAEVVLSSTWRRQRDNLKRVIQMLYCIGHEMISATPVLDGRDFPPFGPTRGDEIRAWLTEEHFFDRVFEREQRNVVILDDDQDMGDLRPFCVFTDSDIGLTPELAEEVIRRLTCDAEAGKTADP